MEKLDSSPDDFWVRGGAHPGQVASLSQRDEQLFALTFTPTGSLEQPVDLISMSLGGRKPEHPEESDTRRKRDFHTERKC